MNNNSGFCEKHDGFERGINGEDNEQSQKFEGKLKGFKKLSTMRKTCNFRD